MNSRNRSSKQINARLERFLAINPLLGLRNARQRKRFVEKLTESVRKLAVLRGTRFHGGSDPSQEDFHPLRCIVENHSNGNVDEAVWLAFLCIQFGWDARASARNTIRCFYSKF